MRLLKKPVFNELNHAIIDYPTPSNITYFWNFGVLAGLCLVIQLITGILLAMHYTPHVDLAFLSVEHIMRDVNYGWLLRYVHANGASMFFIVVYIHIFRGLYYGSYNRPRRAIWNIGVIILLLMMATAFMGYVLPWGQMSFWGATVITNLFSAIPVVGEQIVYWLWGGFSVDNATLNRFFSLHYLMPFTIAGCAGLHLIVLHLSGSNNPLGVWSSRDRVPFTPYFYVKDLYGVIIFGIFFSFFVYFSPNMLGHPDNYIEANPLVTPAHIVPEWYFLPFYAILRSIPDKLGGVVAMVLAIFVLSIFSFIAGNEIRSSQFRPIYRKLFWLLLVDSIILGWIGGKTPEYPYIQIGQLATVYYFAYFLVFIPLLSKFESAIYKRHASTYIQQYK
uniref:Cytochrome b n=1 Tax=Tsukubamonas globosa TaxID=875863 RepID=W8VJU5_9EUKA|nr:cytochrome b [Tsukubamonas globosa]BAO51945.1 cytochrome b [Tsukubamonas globosa]